VDDEHRHLADFGDAIPTIAVWMRIEARDSEWIIKRDLANAQRQLVPVPIPRVLLRIPDPPQIEPRVPTIM
jgi:hypothetical protein